MGDDNVEARGHLGAAADSIAKRGDDGTGYFNPMGIDVDELPTHGRERRNEAERDGESGAAEDFGGGVGISGQKGRDDVSARGRTWSETSKPRSTGAATRAGQESGDQMGVTVRDLWLHPGLQNWRHSVAKGGFGSSFEASVVALLRLVLWHAVPPAALLLSFLAYQSDMGHWQRVASATIALRAFLDLLALPLLVVVQPSALLVAVSPKAPEGQHEGILLHAFAPETLVCIWLSVALESSRLHLAAAVIGGGYGVSIAASDIAAIAALLSAAQGGLWAAPTPLIVAWAVAALSGFSACAVVGGSTGSPCAGGGPAGSLIACALLLGFVALLTLLIGQLLPRVPDMAAVIAAPALVVAVVGCTLGCLYPLRQRSLHLCGLEVSINNVTFQLLRWTIVVGAPGLLLLSLIDWALVPDVPHPQ